MAKFLDPKVRKARRQYDPVHLASAFQATQMGMSVYAASRRYHVPESTLRDRTRGNVTMGANPGTGNLFSDKEEKQLTDHIKYMADIGYGYTKANVQYLASDFAVTCGKKDANDKPLSDCWFYAFMRRWPDLKLAKPQKLAIIRAKSASREVLDKYFKELATILTNNNLREKPSRIYNIDETGVNTEHAPPKVVCASDTHAQAVTSSRSSNVTIIGGGNAIGNHVPPYYVFPGKRWNPDLMEGAPPGAVGKMSESGWSNSIIFQDYLINHFARHAGIVKGNLSEPTLILYDGHKSHISLTLVDWAKEHNVVLFVLPPHTSHITQPLDIGVFGPFKSMYHRECQMFLQKNPGMHVTKYDIAKLTSKPYQKAMSPDNLTAAFKKAGIYPFNNKVVPDSQVAPSVIYQTKIASPDADDILQATDDKQPAADSTQSATDVIPPTAEESYPATEFRLQDAEVHHDTEPTAHVVQATRPTPLTAPKKVLVQDKTGFFQRRTITKAVQRPRKKFVPPYLAGSLAKQSIVNILKASNSKVSNSSPKVQTNQSAVKSSFKIAEKKQPSILKPATSSPQPGPSAFYVDDSDKENSDDSLSMEEDESSNCCVCHKFQPPALKNCYQLCIVKWAQCDKCQHWTHLSFCCDTRVVRRHGEFLCPHCSC